VMGQNVQRRGGLEQQPRRRHRPGNKNLHRLVTASSQDRARPCRSAAAGVALHALCA
jgi:hypothetical protein